VLSKHPFLSVRWTCSRAGVSGFPLEFLARDDIDQYLALEFPGIDFPGQFASLIHAKTEGNPLFMTDVVITCATSCDSAYTRPVGAGADGPGNRDRPPGTRSAA
jgi:predicted ATPase